MVRGHDKKPKGDGSNAVAVDVCGALGKRSERGTIKGVSNTFALQGGGLHAERQTSRTDREGHLQAREEGKKGGGGKKICS